MMKTNNINKNYMNILAPHNVKKPEKKFIES